MATFLGSILLPIAVGAVALVLLLGLINMMRGGSPDRSQRLMRLRVLLQFVAIVITMLAVWAMGRGIRRVGKGALAPCPPPYRVDVGGHGAKSAPLPTLRGNHG